MPLQTEVAVAVHSQRWHSRWSTLIQSQTSCYFCSLSCWILLPSPQLIHSYCQCTSSSDYMHSADLQHVGKVGDDLMVSNRDHISRTNAVTLLHWVLYRGKPWRKQCNSKMGTKVTPCQAAVHSCQQWRSKDKCILTDTAPLQEVER